MTDFPVVKVHVDELSSAQIWLHKLCATLSASVNINYRPPIKVYYRIIDISESNNSDWIKYLYPPTHIKTQNTFWLPSFIS